MKKPKNIPTYYDFPGTPIFRDTTALPFLDGGPLNDKTPPNLNQVMNGSTESFNKSKPNSVLAYNPYAEATRTPNPSAYIRPNYYTPNNNYKYGFVQPTGGNIIGGVGYGIPKHGLEGNLLGVAPAEKNPYFKGFYSAGLSKQIGANKIGLSVGSPVTGYTDEAGFHANKLQLEPQINFKRTFLDGGPLVDKTNHGKLLNSVYASALGDYYKTGGQFPRPYSLPEDSFKQGGDNLHNSVYASSMAQYPATYKYGGSFDMPHMPLDNVERYGGYQQAKHPNQYAEGGMLGGPGDPVKPIYVSDPNDPRIGWYTEAGNQFLYKEPTKAKPVQSKPEVGKLPTKKLTQTPEIIPSNYSYTPQEPETIRTASRSQTVMEPDPDREGKYRIKEMRQVPYSANFPGEGWQPANAPRVLYIDSKGNEVEERPKEFKNGGSILSMSNTPQLEGEGKDLTYPDGAYVYDGGGNIRISPFSYHGDTPGLYRFSTQNPTFNINYSQPFGERVAKDQGFESFSGGLTARLPYKSNTKIGVEGNLRAVGRPNRSSTMTVETDLSGGWDPNVGPYANFIASPQFMFGNVSPTKSKVYGTGLHGGEYLGKVGPFLGASFTPRPQAFTAHANDAKKGAVETTPQAGGMPFGVKGSIDFGLGRKGIRAGLSGYLGADLMGMGLKRSDAQLEGPEVQQGGLGIRTNYGAQANLTIPIKSAKSYVKNIIDEKKEAEIELQDSNPRYASAPKFKNGGVIETNQEQFKMGGQTTVLKYPNNSYIYPSGRYYK